MTVSKRRLSGLWPWLLMVALQVVFGQTGLELVAAVESERATPRAVIKVTLMKHEPPGEPITVEGEFVGGSAGHADGKLMQYHPMSLCNTSEDERQESSFITIVKLERSGPRCLALLDKARLALERGAQAVIFDVTDDANAAAEMSVEEGTEKREPKLQEKDFLPHPVVIVRAKHAEQLMMLVNRNEEASVRIDMPEPTKSAPGHDAVILLTIVLAILAIVMIFAFRYKCKSSRTWDSVHQQTMRAISRLETKTYSTQGCSGSQHLRGAWGSASSSNSSPMCAICLEDFQDGQEVRIISCAHEFHKDCVDPWLLQHRTCPLCMHNIMGAERQPQRARLQAAPRQRHGFLHPQQYGAPHGHPFPRHAVPFSLRPDYPAGPSGPYPSIGHYSGTAPIDAQALRFLAGRPLGPSCGYHLPAEGPHRLGEACRTSVHGYGPRRPCLSYRPSCPAQRGTAGPRHTAPSGAPGGGSYRADHSGYLADGPASDSSSGPCHGSSSDSVLNCTDVSLEGVFGSCSTFRSSLNSDYDPFVYYGPPPAPGPAPRRSSLEAAAQARPRSLDSVVVRPCRPEDPPPRTVFSHIHYHRHRHHHYEDGESGRGPRVSDEEQGPADAPPDRDSPGRPRTRGHCRCSPADRPGLRTEAPDPEPSVPGGPGPQQLEAPCCHKRSTPPHRGSGRLGGCRRDNPSVGFHQSLDLQDDCSIHIHYGQAATSYCCPPPARPAARLPVPLILDSGGVEDWPCCGGAHVVWHKRVQQAHSEPQLLGPRASMDRPSTCRFHHGPTDVCLYCHAYHHNQGSEEESGV